MSSESCLVKYNKEAKKRLRVIQWKQLQEEMKRVNEEFFEMRKKYPYSSALSGFGDIKLT